MNNLKRNLILAVLCLVFALFLYGCGSSAPAATATPAATEAVAATEAPVESAEPQPGAEAESEAEAAEPEPDAAPVATLPDAGLVQDTDDGTESKDLFELAKTYVDKPFSELQAEIGEPVSASYVSSCLIPGGQDGELHYDGFTVYTVKSGDTETVQDVIAD